MAKISYHTLNSQRREIRVLHLFPAPPDEPISCKLETTSLDAPPEYHALSYVWSQSVHTSDPAVSSVIQLDGVSAPVTANLFSALHHLRLDLSTKPLCLWVDSLCINQQDVGERSQQVAMMRDIYACASEVIIWLGEGDSDSEAAFDALPLCVTPPASNAYELTKTHAMKNVSSFFFTLAEKFPWFRRVWILQELAVARTDPRVVCGQRSAPWSRLVAAWDAIARQLFVELGLIQPVEQRVGSLVSGIEHDAAGQRRPEAGASENGSRHQNIKLDVLNQLRSAIQAKGGEGLGRLMLISRTSLSTDPRDRIYGVLGLLAYDKGRAAPITIDYRKTVCEVYFDAMVHLLSIGEGLFFLSGSFLPGIGSSIPDPADPTTPLPTWVPDFSRQTGELAVQPTGDLFRPPASLGGASGAGSNCINGKCLDDKRTLKVEGLLVDKVRQVVSTGDSLGAYIAQLPQLESLSNKAVNEPADSSTFGASTSLVNQFKGREPLWRILISNKAFGSASDQAPDYYAEMYDRLLSSQAPISPDKLDSERSQYELCLKAGVGKRSFFISESGFVGTCVPDTREGDVVVILFGSPTPFVIRPSGRSLLVKDVQREVHGLVGGAYVGGIMNGEMVDELYCEDLMDSTSFFIQ